MILGFNCCSGCHWKFNPINHRLRFKIHQNLSSSKLSNPIRILTWIIPRSYPHLNRIPRRYHHTRTHSKPIQCVDRPFKPTKIETLLPSSSSNSSNPTTQLEFRSLMRQLSYPVTILTVSLGSSHSHGSTISSFTSISIEPEPLISISIRLPSRLASYLSQRTDQPFSIYCLDSRARSIELAKIFSRPKDRLDPQLFETLDRVCIGKLECQIRQRLDLVPPTTSDDDDEDPKPIDGSSALFIARVIRSHLYSEGSSPLMYHNQSYTTIQKDS